MDLDVKRFCLEIVIVLIGCSLAGQGRFCHGMGVQVKLSLGALYDLYFFYIFFLISIEGTR